MATLEANNTYLIDLSSDFVPAHIDVDEYGNAYIVIVDSIEFHENRLERELDEADLDNLERKIRVSVPAEFQADTKLGAEFSGDENIEVSLHVGNQEGKKVADVVAEYWDFIAAVNNLLDPGTLGWEYAFSE